jgi:hypothetical protein
VRHNSRRLRQREARHGRRRAGPWPVQLRFECSLTGEEYVSQHAWRNASLSGCPLHPKGGCGFARHGTYERRSPPGTLIARWYCRQGHRTFSLLPDCLAARLPGTLAELEALVGAVEQARSLEAACTDLRLEIELPGVLRWVRRRVQSVHASLLLLKGILPELFEGCEPTLAAFSRGWISTICFSSRPSARCRRTAPGSFNQQLARYALVTSTSTAKNTDTLPMV